MTLDRGDLRLAAAVSGPRGFTGDVEAAGAARFRRSCRCARYKGQPCSNAVTAEDLLCDACRDGYTVSATADSRFQMRYGCSVVLIDGVPLTGHSTPDHVSVT